MMNELYTHILTNISHKKKMLAVLLDPDKCTGKLLESVLNQLQDNHPDFIFIGGSSASCSSDDLFEALRELPTPKILFPGDASQFSAKADALLLLSLISGRNPDYLIGQHVATAKTIQQSGVEVIPVGYILIDGGTLSSVARLSQTQPIGAENIELAVATALAGQMLGVKMIYLEAGSGAKNPVSAALISAVKKELTIPLIVGGGIKNLHQLQEAYVAGADLVVVGNVFECETERIEAFVREAKQAR